MAPAIHPGGSLMFTHGGIEAYAIATLTTAYTLAQTVDSSPLNGLNPTSINQLGLTGILAAAVIVLWRKVQEKDAVLMQNYKSMAEALAANKAVVEKMSDTLNDIRQTVEHMDTVRASLVVPKGTI